MSEWLPLVFMAIMGAAILAYVVLDGYDLGVGILLRRVDDADKDLMIASIGPFWDANETWLVLGVGVLLIAFPAAHGAILTALYLPVAAMLIGLILRGVSFDFRAKVRAERKHVWNHTFYAGSLLAAAAQGFMLGHYIVGFEGSPAALAFAAFIAASLVAGYCLLGATWLMMKCVGDLRRRAVRWAYGALWLTGGGIAAVSVATPLVSARIFDKWFSTPEVFWLLPIPLASAVVFFACERTLAALKRGEYRPGWRPFVYAVSLFVLAFAGLAYSLYPYLVVDRITIWDAASATKSLQFILVGVAITLPAIIGYTIYAYRVFWGKATHLSYD